MFIGQLELVLEGCPLLINKIIFVIVDCGSSVIDEFCSDQIIA
jgi:hypothetical protein